MTRRARHSENVILPLYPSEEQIAQAIMGERAGEWPAKAVILEREGLPPVDAFMGGRCWAKVQRFFAIREGLDAAPATVPDMPKSRIRIVDLAPDGPENPYAETAQSFPHRRGEHQARRRSGA